MTRSFFSTPLSEFPTDHYEEDLPPLPDLGCLNPKGYWRHRRTRATRWVGCGTNGCFPCVDKKIPGIIWCVRQSRPTQFFTLTQVGKDSPTIKKCMTAFKRRMKATGHPLVCVWAAEWNPKRTGNHLHGYHRGCSLPGEVLRAASVRAGMGQEVGVRSVGPNEWYGYLTKTVVDQSTLDRYRVLNGSDFVHGRGFWLNAKGEPANLKALFEAKPAAAWRADWEFVPLRKKLPWAYSS